MKMNVLSFHPVTGGSQAQPGQAGRTIFTGLQIGHFGLFKLRTNKTLIKVLILVKVSKVCKHTNLALLQADGPQAQQNQVRVRRLWAEGQV